MSPRIFAVIIAAFLVTLASCSTDSVKTDSAKIDVESVDEVLVEKKYKIILVSGFESDPTAAQIAGTGIRGVGNSGIFQLCGDLKKQGHDCQFFNWNGTDAGDIHNPDPGGSLRIAQEIEKTKAEHADTDFVFVAHSWGAHTALEVSKILEQNSAVKIDSIFVIDPSSLMRGERMKALPKNIPKLTNYFTGNMFCWGEWKDESRVENIALGNSENGFNSKVNYGAAFDTAAHTHAEWDEKIHADISVRIESIVNADE